MISDQKLLDCFLAESRLTGRAIDGIRAVRIAVEATMEDARSQTSSDADYKEAATSGLLPRLEPPRLPAPARVPFTPAQFRLVVELVAADLRIPDWRPVMTGTRRPLYQARWVIASVAHHHGVSYPQIAHFFGLRSHSQLVRAVHRLPGFHQLAASRDRVLVLLASAGLQGGPVSSAAAAVCAPAPISCTDAPAAVAQEQAA